MSVPRAGRGRASGESLLLPVAGIGALLDALRGGFGIDAALAGLFVAAAAAGSIPVPPAFRFLSSSRARRALLPGAMAAFALASVLLGTGAAAPLAVLLPACRRRLFRRSPPRRLRTIRDALVAATGILLLRGSEGALLAMAGTVLLAAFALPCLLAPVRDGAAGSPAGPPPRTGRQRLLLAGAVAAAAPVLFVLLPRFSEKAGREPPPPARPRERPRPRPADTGPIETVTNPALHEVHLGDIGRLQRDFRPLVEASFFRDGRPAFPGSLGPLLRNAALEEFDGMRWRSPAARGVLLEDRMDGIADGWTTLPRRALPAPPGGERWEQDLHFLVGGTDSLFCLGMPEAVGGPGARGGARVFPRGEVRAADAYPDGTRFRVRSVVARGPFPILDAEEPDPGRLALLLAVPEGHERAVALATAELRGAGRGRPMLRRLQALLNGRCSYSLEILPNPRWTPVETFLFDTRRGHCELFASAAAVMLRGIGVPARVAVGFRGGESDPASGLTVFRGADAHAWVEAHLEGIGWVTFDPTPGAAPGPAGEGEAAASGEEGGALDLLGGVMEFDAAAQRRLLLGAAGAAGRGLRLVFLDGRGRPDPAVLLALAAIAGALWLRHRRRAGAASRAGGRGGASPAPAPIPEAWALLQSRLDAAGIRRGPAETVGEFARRAAAAGASPAEAVRRVARAHDRERWGGIPPGPGDRAALLAAAAAVAVPRRPVPARTVS